GDDRADRGEAERVAHRLVEAGVLAVVGSYSSDATEPAARVYDEAGVLQITPSATATRLSEPGYKKFFRTCFVDDRQGEFAANLMVNKMDKRRIALIHDNTAYALGLAEWTRKYLEELKGQIVLFTAIRPGQRDFTGLLNDIRAAQVEAVYFSAYFPEAGLFVKQMKEAGLADVQFVGGDAIVSAGFIDAAGVQAAAGTVVTSMPQPGDLPYPETEKFVDDYLAKYGEQPTSIYALTAADAFKLIVEAIEETGSDNPALWADYLHNLDTMAGITGPIVGFNEKGERQGNIYAAYQVNPAGEFVAFKP
ncbi:MAG: branched-chain amino acid ABC transporter substrate-binding protein, partial [Chloroflexota bacterium]